MKSLAKYRNLISSVIRLSQRRAYGEESCEIPFSIKFSEKLKKTELKQKNNKLLWLTFDKK
jgi:hypothetical protein